MNLIPFICICSKFFFNKVCYLVFINFFLRDIRFGLYFLVLSILYHVLLKFLQNRIVNWLGKHGSRLILERVWTLKLDLITKWAGLEFSRRKSEVRLSANIFYP